MTDEAVPHRSRLNEVEVVPGTVHLVDIAGDLETKRGTGTEHDIVLVPAPSAHPDDPLNWRPRRKYISAFCMALYVFVVGMCASALYSTLNALSDATGLTYHDLNSGTGYMFLLLGWGCVLWQAVAVQYGKRPVYLITLAGTLGVMIWQPHITTSGEWYAAKVLQGIFGAPMESIAEITVSDVFFTHERGKYMALYALALGYSNGVAPLIMGFINNGQGYQWVFYWCAIFCGVAFVVIFFFMEETSFDRSPYMANAAAERRPPVDNAADSSVTAPKDDNDASATHAEDNAAGRGAADKSATGLFRPTTVTTVDGSAEYMKKSYAARLKPMEAEGFRRKNKMLRLMYRPFQLLTFPIIAYAGFLYGANIIWLSVLNATEAMVLSDDPYNMSTSIIGVTFIAPLVGTTLASAFSGLFGDSFILKMARRNKGFMEAEHRLWLLVPSLLLIPFGCILFGVGAYHSVHWFGIVFAMGVISFTTTAGSQICIAYAIDCYRDLGAEALASVMIIRNTMSFGIGYAVTPWVTGLGYQNAFIVGAFAGIAHNLTIFPVIKWGRKLREKSADRYWDTVEKGRDLDVTH